MSRPKPTILLDHTDPKTYKSSQVLAADGVYAVLYNGKPVNLRNLDKLGFNKNGKESTPKYGKVSFANKGHAFNLANKLNLLSKTTNFQVYLFTDGQAITEHS